MELNINDIKDVIPHRYPFLLVDRIVEIEKGDRVVGIKNVTYNEPFFQGHFPEKPVMPGVLVIESMAQTGAVLLLADIEDKEDKLVYFMSIDNVKFRKPVVPGDRMRIEVEVLNLRSRTCKIRCEAFVEEELVTEAEIMSALVDREDQ